MKQPLTGKHVLAITVASFGIIIAVNLVMAFQAVSTFPGLEVKNSYVASQQFDRARIAQDALHWTVTPEYDGQVFSLAITDETGAPARLRDLEVNIGRPTHVREDQTLKLSYNNGLFETPLHLGDGAWIIHLRATASDGTAFQQRLDLHHRQRG